MVDINLQPNDIYLKEKLKIIFDSPRSKKHDLILNYECVISFFIANYSSLFQINSLVMLLLINK